jgi:drug/metabolite transporter (DMT)-like permease
VALAALAVVPLPARESWPWLGFGVLLHVSYQLFLLTAYRFGDLGQVYPLARGSAPLFIAMVSVGLLGVTLAPAELLGIAVIVSGILMLGIGRLGGGDGRAAAFALGTGAFIAAYSLVDGAGARLSGSPVGYFAVNCLANAAIFTSLVSRLRPGTLAQVPVTGWRPLVIGGPASFVAYSLIVWAFTEAPIALVAALRETSIVFALAIGAVFLGETPGRTRILAAGMTLVGAVLLSLAA